MYYSLSKLNPATLHALKEELDQPSNAKALLEKLKKFLSGDGKSVAEQDLAFSTASELSAAGIVEKLPVSDLSVVLSSVNKSKAQAFKSGLARQYRAAIEKHEQEVGAKSVATPRTRKKIAGTMKLQVPAGQANPSPPVGPALGQRGINIMEFCKAFNARTQSLEPGAPCPTVVTYYQDKTFSIDIKTPPASYYLKKAAKVKGSAGRKTATEWVTVRQVREIAEAKMKDLSVSDVDAAMKIVIKDAASMGISVKKQ
jgi:large subunit ribosomal protein L11